MNHKNKWETSKRPPNKLSKRKRKMSYVFLSLFSSCPLHQGDVSLVLGRLDRCVFTIHSLSDRRRSRTGSMTDDLQYWHATGGQLTTTTERYQHETSSLKWEWTSSSLLTYTNPQAFRSIKWATNKCFALWLYSGQQPESDPAKCPQPIRVEFLSEKDPKPLAEIWFHVNFSGWRPLGLRYALLPSLKTNLSRVHGLRFYAPSNVDNGVFILNGIHFDYVHSIGPKADYQQPWASPDCISRLNDNPMAWSFVSNNIFHNRPWLAAEQVNSTSEDVAKVKARWLSSLPYGTW